MWQQLVALSLATLASEDLTCLTAGLLVRHGRLLLLPAIAACAAGIFVGDVGLWLAGRLLGRRVLRWRFFARRLPESRLRAVGEWLNARGPALVLASRFMPGTRLPIYLACGIVGDRPGRFIAAMLVAVLLWTPLLVGAAALFGETVAAPLERAFGVGWVAWIAAAGLLLVLLRGVTLAATERGRARLIARISLLWRWEFWPAWLLYLPLVPYFAWLALRHGGLTVPTAANPAIPHGGVVGESKYDILTRLPGERVVPSLRVDAGPVETRSAMLRDELSRRGWHYPLIFKPDTGERGARVRLIADPAAAHDYLAATDEALLIQHYHAGPFEAGIFYVRLPDEPAGRIFAITDKRFPELTGDGVSTVASLIYRHSRYRMQADRFLARLNGKADRVLAAGETLRLALAGNHCQGTMFLDGESLRTAALERAVDEIVSAAPGICFGRMDVRYADREAFRAGRDLTIIEMNGVLSEATNIYDPRRGLFAAWWTLAQQWSFAFRIGAANRRNGAATSSVATLWRVIRDYRSTRPNDDLSD